MDKVKIVVVSGGFDPVHAGHTALFTAARRLGHFLFVGLNSDQWLARKKGKAFMPWPHRAEIVRSMMGVDRVFNFDDSDGSARQLLEHIKTLYPPASNYQIIFANGGDRNETNIPEMDVADIEFVFGVGGEHKQASSSELLREWKEPKVERSWGEYRVLYDNSTPGCATKVKELTVNGRQRISLQRHQHRSELWFVVDGECELYTATNEGRHLPPRTLRRHQIAEIPSGNWHQLINPHAGPCRLIEIQFGHLCYEEDIERR